MRLCEHVTWTTAMWQLWNRCQGWQTQQALTEPFHYILNVKRDISII